MNKKTISANSASSHSLRRPSMLHVANMAGVDKSTVSRVLGNRPGVAEKTRNKVIEACEALGYQMNRSIQDLVRETRNQSTGSIGFVLVGGDFYAPEYVPLTANISKSVEKYDCTLILTRLTGKEKSTYDLPPVLRDRRVDGVLITGDLRPEIIHLIEEQGIPCVILGNYSNGVIENSTVVRINGPLGVYKLVRHMKQAGKTRIAYVDKGPVRYVDERGLPAFKDALTENGLDICEDIIFPGTDYPERPYSQLQQSLSCVRLPFDAIYCPSFSTAGEVAHLLLGWHGSRDGIPTVLGTFRTHPSVELPVPAIYCEHGDDEVAAHGVTLLVDRLRNAQEAIHTSVLLSPKVSEM